MMGKITRSFDPYISIPLIDHNGNKCKLSKNKILNE